MPSKNMLPKGHRHRSVRAEYVATRGVETPTVLTIPTIDLDLYHQPNAGPATHTITTPLEAAGLRLDQYLAQAIPEVSRSRVQLLIAGGQVHVDGAPAKPKHKLTPGELIVITGSPRPAPLNATAEDIPLDIVFEDEFLAIVNKPAGMMVHAGAAAPTLDTATDPKNLSSGPEAQRSGAEVEGPASSATAPGHDPRSAGTLVNALLHHFNHHLSNVGGDLRPGIVHRLDKQTSGLLIVAKDDTTHRKLGEMFSAREVGKTYLALVHGHVPRKDITVNLPIGRDIVRRTRMTTRRASGSQGVRSATSHVHVLDRLSTPHGPFTLVEVAIETGRTHQIRVHLQSLGHPVVGDNLYGAPHQIRLTPSTAASTDPPTSRKHHPERSEEPALSLPKGPASLPHRPAFDAALTLSLPRNFLHAARLSLIHPRTGKPLLAEAPLPPELTRFLTALQSSSAAAPIESRA